MLCVYTGKCMCATLEYNFVLTYIFSYCIFQMLALIDLHWVWARMAPMHLDLIDGPFVPHNLISAQESPVPIPKFQMAPRLKILISSGSKKGTQIYYPFLSKVPASESTPGSPVELLWREMSVSRAFFNISSRVPSKVALPRVPPHWASSERNSPFWEPPSSISQSPW